LPALELALEGKLDESGDSQTHLELSWRSGGSTEFFNDLFGFFELIMVVVVRGREVYILLHQLATLHHAAVHCFLQQVQGKKHMGKYNLVDGGSIN